MFCKNCGGQINEQASVCTQCGFAKGAGSVYCPSCGETTNEGAQVCVKCGTTLHSVNEQKSKIAAGLLGIFLGGFGVHRFYLGYIGLGIAQIVVTLITCGIGSLWGFIEGILILTGNMNQDAEGRPLKE